MIVNFRLGWVFELLSAISSYMTYLRTDRQTDITNLNKWSLWHWAGVCKS